MDHFVRLDQLPTDLQSPNDLKERIWYDAANQRLCFRGFMSKAEFDRLCQLSDDWSFRRSLEELFRLCVPDPPPRRGLGRLAAALAGLGF